MNNFILKELWLAVIQTRLLIKVVVKTVLNSHCCINNDNKNHISNVHILKKKGRKKKKPVPLKASEISWFKSMGLFSEELGTLCSIWIA